jgi:lipid-binding SYLF domain-containing protein
MKPHRITGIAAYCAALLLATSACSHQETAEAPQAENGAAQQAIVNRSADAFRHVRGNPAFQEVEALLARARGVMIFPRLVKASLIFGGEGGNGVLVARAPDGGWTDPAFYSLGAPSVGLQIGYQEATVVLFFMEQHVLDQAMHADLTLGANQTVAVGSAKEASDGEVLTKPIYQLVESRGAFAGVSLDGYVIGARNKHNTAYYGPTATPRSILVEGTSRRPEAQVLHQALAAPSDPPPSAGL